MGKKLTQEQYKQKVFEAVGDRFTVISEYKGRTFPIKLHCNIHDIDFSANAECFMRGPKDIRANCPKCAEDYRNKDKVKLICDYCGKEFFRAKCKADLSKSGQNFCCRECKDLAQRITSGEKFDKIRPSHYGTGANQYREIAFHTYKHECAVCGYKEDSRILQVHHRDSNRGNCSVDNLVILCPNCHWKITLGLYELTEDNCLVEK